jgi:hypothetical protein
LEIEGGVISSLMQKRFRPKPAEITSHSTMREQPQVETEAAPQLFDNWSIRRAREFLQAMLEGELDEVLDRSGYAPWGHCSGARRARHSYCARWQVVIYAGGAIAGGRQPLSTQAQATRRERCELIRARTGEGRKHASSPWCACAEEVPPVTVITATRRHARSVAI